MSSARVGADAGVLGDPLLKEAVQKLEETCERLQADEVLQVMRQDTTSAAHIPDRIQEILEENLSPQMWTKALLDASSMEEVEFLKTELERAHGLLHQSQKDRQELGTKYIAVSSKIEKMLELEQEVRRLSTYVNKLEREKESLQHHLRSEEYSHATEVMVVQQQQQEANVQLKQQMEEYKRRCTDLEAELAVQEIGAESNTQQLLADLQTANASVAQLTERLEKREAQLGEELKAALTKGEEQQQRAVQLSDSNVKLRDELDQTRSTTGRLNEEVLRLSGELNAARQRLNAKEREWEERMKSSTSTTMRRYTDQLGAALGTVVDIQKEFSDVKIDTQRDLRQLHDDLNYMVVEVGTSVTTQVQDYQDTIRSLKEQLEDVTLTAERVQGQLDHSRLEYQSMKTQLELREKDLRCKLAESCVAHDEIRERSDERRQVIDELDRKRTELESFKTALSSALNEEKEKTATLRKEMELHRTAFDCIMLTVQGLGVTAPSSREEEKEEVPCGKEQSGAVVVGSKDASLSRGKRPVWIAGSPLPIGSDGDGVRSTDWVVSHVRSAVGNLQGKIRELEASLISTREQAQQEQLAKRDLEGEVRSHLAASTMLKKELDAVRASMSKVSVSRSELDKQLQEALNDKLDVERRLSQVESQAEALLGEKLSAESTCQSLQESARKLQFQVDELQQHKESLQTDVATRAAAMRKLELQTSSLEEEAQDLRVRMGRAEGEKMEKEREATSLRLSIQTLELERDENLRRMRSKQETESKTVATLEGVQEAKCKLEEEKRHLSSNLEKIQGLKVQLDEENAALRREKMEALNEVTKLQHAVVQLSAKVEHLDSQLELVRSDKKELFSEGDKLKQENANTVEALGKTKQCLAEIQVQRGKLTATVAKMAQEKGELVRERVTLMSQLAQTEELLQGARDKVASLEASGKHLQERIRHLEGTLTSAEQNQSVLMEANDSLRQEKQSLSLERSLYEQAKEEELHRIAGKKEEELQTALKDATRHERELQEQLELIRRQGEKRLSLMASQHQAEVRSLIQQQKDVVSYLNNEIQSLTQSKQSEVERLALEKQSNISKLGEEKSFLYERLSRLQKLYDEKCEEARHQQQQATQLLAEQRQQLESSQLDAERVGHEFKQAEEELQELRKKLDSVKLDTQQRITAMKEQLKSSAHSVSHLEESQHDTEMRLKEAETRRDAYKKQLNDCQKQFQAYQEEKEGLTKECHGLKVQLLDNDRAQARLTDTVGHLEARLAKADEDRTATKAEVIQLQESVDRSQNAVTKLSEDTTQLQSALTAAENKRVAIEVELKHAVDKLQSVQQEKEELLSALTALQGKLETVNHICGTKEQEVGGFKRRVSNLEMERDGLFVNLSQLQDNAKLQGQADALKLSELHSEIRSLKMEKECLEDYLEKQKAELESHQERVHALESSTCSSMEKLTALTSQLSKVDTAKKDVQSKYARLLGILQGTLGLEISPPVEAIPEELNDSASFTQNAARVIHSTRLTPHMGSRKTATSPESGLGASFFGGSQTSFAATPNHPSLRHNSWSASSATSPSQLCAIQLDEDSVKEAILGLQRKLIDAQRGRDEALSQVRTLDRQVKKLENEKSAIESKMSGLRASVQSLQEKHDQVRLERDRAELSASTSQMSLKEREQQSKGMADQMQYLEAKNATQSMTQQMNEASIRKHQQTESELLAEKQRLLELLRVAEEEKAMAQSAIADSKKERASFQSAKLSQDAQVTLLQQKLTSSQHQIQETTEQMCRVQEALKVADGEVERHASAERQLQQQVVELNEQLSALREENTVLEGSIQDLQLTLTAVKKEKETLEDRLGLLQLSREESDQHMEFLRQSVHGLQDQLVRKGSSHSDVVNQLRAVEESMTEQSQHAEGLKAKISEIEQAKKLLQTKVDTLSANLTSMERSRQVSQELASHLERELNKTRASYQKLQEENAGLRLKLEDSHGREKQLDILLTHQRRKKADLDTTASSNAQENLELQSRVHELKAAISEKDHQHLKKINELRGMHSSDVGHQVDKFRLQEQEWASREQEYRKRIQQLEAKMRTRHDTIPKQTSTPARNPASRSFLHSSPRHFHSATSTPFKTRPPL